jgi:hypothetical protein
VPLTGWETDDRGGFWEASPVGFLPDQFGFHVDWFRLHDTSRDDGVTIRHQIARQTSGLITWEFRFMMPEVMDGACWQLRDLNTAAVNLVVRDGQLCRETADAKLPVLKQIEAEREYGVRVVVNLTERKACLFVDGELLVSDVPLLGPVESLDYVLIATGSEAMGQLYLPVVNVHKGYRVNERFLAAGTGRLPDDWQRHIIPYWIEYFFKDPRYLKIDGKPVLAIYHLKNLLADFGGEEGTAQAVTVLREACRMAGFPGIVILCEERYARQTSIEQMNAIGMDYCYAYTWVTGDIQRQRQMMEAQRDASAEVGLGVVPSISVGWEPTPWGNAGHGWASVDDYKALTQWTKDTYMHSLPEDSIGTKMVLLPNWNEFGEGHFIMPSTLAGFGYVDAIREVFSGAVRHKDAVPTAAQKRRFTVLYPRD